MAVGVIDVHWHTVVEEESVKWIWLPDYSGNFQIIMIAGLADKIL
jgi:hypothetical protein